VRRGSRCAVAICLLGLGCRSAAPARTPGGAGPSAERAASAVAAAAGDCASQVKAFREKRFADLRGLPAACRLNDVATELGVRPGASSGWLGEQQRQLSFQVAVVPGFAEPIRVWYDQGFVLLLDAEYPEPPGDWAALRTALGPPEVKLDYRWGVVNVVGGEWFYPARGLTIFLTPALDKVIRVATFAPTPLATYRQSLRPVSQLEERPVRPGGGP